MCFEHTQQVTSYAWTTLALTNEGNDLEMMDLIDLTGNFCTQCCKTFFLKNGPTAASVSFIFVQFKQTILFLQQINVKKCPSSIGLTARPGLMPKWKTFFNKEI